MPIPLNKTAQELRSQIDRQEARRPAAQPDCAPEGADHLTLNRARLEALLSTDPQLKSFQAATGTEWRESFIPVEQFRRGFHLFGLRGVNLVEHLWVQLPNCRFKRFQELFCEKSNYAIPRPNLEAPCVVYPPRDELNKLPLHACLASPARIPFKLLVDLGIVAEPTRELSDLAALAIKSEPKVIATLKAVWDAAQNLSPGNERILLLRQIDQEKYPNATPLAEDKLGSIIYVRENTAVNRTGTKRDRGTWQAPEQVAAFFPSVYSALRKTDHETAGYQLETMSLGQLSVEWNELTTRAREQWRRNAPDEVKATIRSDLRTLVAKSRAELASVSNHLKREAVNSFAELESRLAEGSNNITTHVTTADAAVRKLNTTINSSSRKSGYNTTDAKQLTALVEKAEHGFKLIADSLFRASARLQDEMKKRDGFFSQKALPSEALEANANSLISKLGIPINAIDPVLERPVRIFALRVRSAYDELKAAILSQDAEQAKRAMVKLVVLSKLQRSSSVFEQLRRLTVCSETVPLKELTRSAASLRSLLELRSVFPQTLVPELQPTFKTIQRRASTIASGLESYRDQGLDLAARTQMYSRLRRYLDETDMEKLVRELPE